MTAVRARLEAGTGRDWLPVGLLVASALAFALGVHRVDPGTLDAYGLIKVISPFTWAGFALVVAAAVLELGGRVRSAVMGPLCGVVVVMVHGLQTLLYGTARMQVGWLHVGFAEQITRYGEVILSYDTRFSWPGFFSAAAMWSEAAGFSTAEPMLDAAPVVLLGLGALAVHGVAVGFFGEGRAAWLATLLFIVADWTEQEYFSPQALAFFVSMSVIALAAHGLVFSIHERVPGLRPWRRPQPPLPPADRLAVQVVILLVLIALAPTHQLTPFMLVGMLAVLALTGRLSSPWLAVIALFVPLVWFVLGGRDFWLGQLSLLTAGAGSLSSSVGEGVAGRMKGSLGHQLVVLGRIAITGLVGALAVAAALVFRGRGRTAVPLAGLAVSAFAIALLQPYGGEIFMRCYLFALPWFAMATGWGLDRLWRQPRLAKRVAAATAALVFLLMAATVGAKGGNDAYVAIAPADVTATKVALEAAKPGQTVSSPLWYTPLRLQRVRDVKQLTPDEVEGVAVKDRSVQDLVDALRAMPADFVVLTPAVENGGVILRGYPDGWTATVRRQLVAAGYRVIHDQDGRFVLERPS